MIETLPQMPANVLGFKMSGKLHDEDYKTFVPLVDNAIAKDGKVRILAQFHDFHGWDAQRAVGRHQVLDHALHEDRTNRARGRKGLGEGNGRSLQAVHDGENPLLQCQRAPPSQSLAGRSLGATPFLSVLPPSTRRRT